jgi:hypothetical protein
MSPAAFIRFQISIDASRWSASLVRMNRSKETLSRSCIAWKVSELRSASSAVGTPSLSAVCAIFRPCTSVPVRKRTSYPSSRLNRAIASVAVFSYAWPMCGAPLG